MNQTEQAFQQAVAVWTSIMSHNYIYFVAKGTEGETVMKTNDRDKSQFDTFGYFHSESDNDDVLYSRYIEPITEDERMREKIYFFVELIREDFEARTFKLPEFNIRRTGEEYERYSLVSRMNRLSTYSLLVSGYYNKFLTLTYLG
jgi:hypothetical protein